MRNTVIVVIIAAVVMSFTFDKRKTVKADGPIVKKERTIGSFDGVSTSCAIDVILVQGNDYSLSIKTEENLHEYIITEVKDNVLHLYTKANIRNSKGMKAFVSMREISSLKASSAGDIIAEETIKTDEIKLSASSAGDIKLKLRAKAVYARTSSAGDIELSGSADFLEASTSSSGDIIAGDFEVKDAHVSASSSGDALVYVTGNLNAKASSNGDVRYMGNPQVEAKTSSAGSVKKK